MCVVSDEGHVPCCSVPILAPQASSYQVVMQASSGWRYLARASSPLLSAPRRSLQCALAVGWSDSRASLRLVQLANPSPSCVLFRRLSDRNTFSTSSSPPSSSSPEAMKKRSARETSPLKGDPFTLSPTDSSRETLRSDEELDDASSDEAPVETLSWKERAKNFAVEYGRVGIATHLVLSVMSISVIYVVISSGVDVSGLLHAVGLSSDSTGKDSVATSAGSFVISYTIYKIASPIRWPITFAVTPVVMRALRRRGYMLPKTNAHRSPRPEEDADDEQARTPK